MSLEDSLSPKRQFMSLEYIPVPRVQFVSPLYGLYLWSTVYVTRVQFYPLRFQFMSTEYSLCPKGAVY